MTSHVAGTLSLAHFLVVARHAEQCPACRQKIHLLEAVGGELLDGLPESPMDDAAWARGVAATEVATSLPSNPGWLATAIRTAGRWRLIGPGIRHVTLLREPAGTLHLLQVRGGTALPLHRHRGLELTCVLEGQFRDSGALYAPGDFAEVDESDLHQPIAEPGLPCICLIATQGRLRFSGWVARLLQPVLPF